MAVETGTATSAADLFARLRTFITTTLGWTQLLTEASPNRVLYQAPGLSGLEEIHIGFRLYEDVPGDTYGFYGWMARAYDSGLDMQAQPGDSGDRFHPLWETSIPYWFIGNGQRIIIVTKVATTYWASYLGKFLQYGTPGEYGQPYYLGMPNSGAIRYSTISENVRNFFDPSNSLVLLPNGTWVTVSNFVENNGESATSSGIWVHPYTTEDAAVRTRWRELRDNPDGSYQCFPLILCGDNPDYNTYGELDGAFAVSGFSAASEDTLTVGADTYIMVQNGFRTARYYFAALPLV